MGQAFGSFMISRPTLGCSNWLEFVDTQNPDSILQSYETALGLRIHMTSVFNGDANTNTVNELKLNAKLYPNVDVVAKCEQAFSL